MKAALFFFLIPALLFGSEIPGRYKLYCMYTPQFQTLLTEYFLPSIQDEFELVVREFPQDCPSGIFRSEGWEVTMLHKLELLKEAIKENWEELFFYADIDIIFLKPILQRCLELLGEHDFLVQQGWPRNALCAGFFVMRGNEQTLRLICIAEQLLKQKRAIDDQTAIQQALQLMKGEIDWEFLPSEEFPNGRRVLRQLTGHYNRDSEIVLPHCIALFHANCCIGLELKMDFLRRVQSAYAEQSLNIETLPYLRTQQYPTAPYKQIVIFSAPRTGSSLVYNVYRYLFEEQSNFSSFHNAFNKNCTIVKTHRLREIESLQERNVLFVITIRNPIDAIISNYRICSHKITSIHDFVAKRIETYKSYLHFYEKLKKSGKNVLFLKFEDFDNDLSYLFECIEKHFNIQIDERDKMTMHKGYSKENVAACIQYLSDFKQCLPISGFHGDHIAIESYTPPEELLYWLNILIEEVKPKCKKYGYFL